MWIFPRFQLPLLSLLRASQMTLRKARRLSFERLSRLPAKSTRGSGLHIFIRTGMGTGYSWMGTRTLNSREGSGWEGRCLYAIKNGWVGFPPGFDDSSARSLCSEVRVASVKTSWSRVKPIIQSTCYMVCSAPVEQTQRYFNTHKSYYKRHMQLHTAYLPIHIGWVMQI